MCNGLVNGISFKLTWMKSTVNDFGVEEKFPVGESKRQRRTTREGATFAVVSIVHRALRAAVVVHDGAARFLIHRNGKITNCRESTSVNFTQLARRGSHFTRPRLLILAAQSDN